MSPEVASLAGAILAFIGGLVAATFTFLAARRQADNTLAGAERTATATLEAARVAAENIMQPTAYGDRARWQMHKRGIYSSLIEAMHSGKPEEFRERSSQARLVANSDLREKLKPFAEGSSGVPDGSERENLIDALSEDARYSGSAN